jgi:hypothetical protein
MLLIIFACAICQILTGMLLYPCGFTASLLSQRVVLNDLPRGKNLKFDFETAEFINSFNCAYRIAHGGKPAKILSLCDHLSLVYLVGSSVYGKINFGPTQWMSIPLVSKIDPLDLPDILFSTKSTIKARKTAEENLGFSKNYTKIWESKSPAGDETLSFYTPRKIAPAF